MNKTDYYAVLGVLPTADPVVIAAAFRALAQRYHPDKWTGDASEAHERMARINEAYEVLRDQARRAAYDRAHQGRDQGAFEESDAAAGTGAFDAALREVEENWGIATSIYPDLQQLRAGLARISTPLAFAYVTGLLDTRAFDKRHELAAHLEHEFLTRYFGTNDEVLRFARKLILGGNKGAARALNKLVDVLGSGADPSLLLAKIEQDFGIRKAQERAAAEKVEASRLQKLVHDVKVMGYYKEARELSELLGYKTEELGGGLFSSAQVRLTSQHGEVLHFKNPSAFVYWAQQNLCTSRSAP